VIGLDDCTYDLDYIEAYFDATESESVKSRMNGQEMKKGLARNITLEMAIDEAMKARMAELSEAASAPSKKRRPPASFWIDSTIYLGSCCARPRPWWKQRFSRSCVS
jgi:hypothetical protein